MPSGDSHLALEDGDGEDLPGVGHLVVQGGGAGRALGRVPSLVRRGPRPGAAPSLLAHTLPLARGDHLARVLGQVFPLGSLLGLVKVNQRNLDLSKR